MKLTVSLTVHSQYLPLQTLSLDSFIIFSSFSTVPSLMSKSVKDLKINSALKSAIVEILSKNPKFDEQKVVEKIKENKIQGLGESAIKSGVKAYFAVNQLAKTESKPLGSQPQPIEILEQEVETKLKKRIKKNEFLIQFEDSPNFKFQKLGGIQEVFDKIRTELFNAITKEAEFKQISRLPPNRGFLLSGSPGSGKTSLANCILSFLVNSTQKRITAYSVNAYEFLGGDADEKFKKLFESAEQTSPSIIFIDDLEQLCNKQNNKRMQSLPSLTLCSYLSRYRDRQIFFLGASSAPEKLDQLTKPGMFYKQLKVSNPDDGQRKQIIDKLLGYYNHNLDVEEHMKELVIMTAGYVAVDFTSLMKEAALRCIDRTTRIESPIEQKQKLINIDDFRAAVKEVLPVLKKDGFAKIPNVKLEDVGALQNIKDELTQQIIMPLKEQEKFKSMNFEVSGGGILLYGPPGCGKTMIAKAIANEANANFITVKGPELLTKYVGESQEAVRKVFERARMSAPCIIFFDQFDALAPKRQDQGNQVTERVVNTLLNELNGVDDRRMVFVIAATNRPDIIDEAVLRSGRIEKHLYVPLPNANQRLEILQKITRKVNRQQQLELEDIASRTENFSGADLYFLVKKSIISAISERREKIEAKDLKSALETYKQDKYNKGNRLKLSQFQQSESSDKEESLSRNAEDGSTSMKKSRSVMQFQKNQKPKPKKSHQSILQNFMEYLLESKKKLKNN